MSTRIGSPGRGRGGRLALLLCLAVLLAGCISERQEQQIGDEMAAEVNQQLPLVRDPLLNMYLDQLGAALAQVSGRPAVDYHFYLVNSAVVNAFALPGGYIYVTRGLVERTRSEAELAGVLAHEIGHVAERHGAQKLERYLRTGSLISTLYNLLPFGEPALLQQNPTRLAGLLWSARHSRKDEQEADRLAVRYLLAAGYDPEAILTLLRTMIAEEGPQDSPIAAWFSSHPLTAERIEKTEREIQRQTARAKARAGASPSRAPAGVLAYYPAFLVRVAMLPPPPDSPLIHP